MQQTYEEFKRGKLTISERVGFDVDWAQLHPDNFPHQNDAIVWAAGRGRALIAMSFGLGKTRIQCELARLIHERTGGLFLIVCPLGVKHQFQEEDGSALGMKIKYVRTDEEIGYYPDPLESQLRFIVTVRPSDPIVGIANIILHDEGFAVFGFENKFLIQNRGAEIPALSQL